MRRIACLFSLSAAILLSASTYASTRILAGGSGWNKIVIFDKSTLEIEWEYPLERGWECNSVCFAGSPERILFSYRKGARMLDRSGKTLWDIKAPEGCEMQTARYLDDGRCLLAWTGHPAVIMETDLEGNILSRVSYELGIRHPHMQFRQVNKTRKGNYIIPVFTGNLIELNPRGGRVREIEYKANFFTLLHGRGDLYWAACGDAHKLVKMNIRTGKVLETLDRSSFPDARLFFVAGLLHNGRGGMYICNWQGHAGKSADVNDPLLIETDRRGKIVWTLKKQQKFGRISAVDIE